MKELATLTNEQLEALYEDLTSYEEEVKHTATIETKTEVSRRIHKVESEYERRYAKCEC